MHQINHSHAHAHEVVACTIDLVAKLEPAWPDSSSDQVITGGLAELVFCILVWPLPVDKRGAIVLPGINTVRQALIIDGHCHNLIVFLDVEPENGTFWRFLPVY